MAHPFQEIFDTVFKTCLESGYDTVHELPDPTEGQDLSRFFVQIGEQYGEDKNNKSAIFGRVNQTIHVFGPIDNRANVLSAMEEIVFKLRALTCTKHYYITVATTNTQVTRDTSTVVTMWHGLLDVGFKFY